MKVTSVIEISKGVVVLIDQQHSANPGDEIRRTGDGASWTVLDVEHMHDSCFGQPGQRPPSSLLLSRGAMITEGDEVEVVATQTGSEGSDG